MAPRMIGPAFAWSAYFAVPSALFRFMIEKWCFNYKCAKSGVKGLIIIFTFLSKGLAGESYRESSRIVGALERWRVEALEG